MLLQGWAEFHDVRMVVELDHCVEGEEYEEVVALYTQDRLLRRWILWRSDSEIVVQPLLGRSCRFSVGRRCAGEPDRPARASEAEGSACQLRYDPLMSM